MSFLARLRPDNFTLVLVATVALGSVLPARGQFAEGFYLATQLSIALLFFLHGARMPREVVFRGLTHWRLHLTVLASTYVLFPVLGLAAGLLAPTVITPMMATGILFLCCLPSTVQSSIAFTSIARGNVPAAVCAASASNLIGVFVTPLLVGVLMSANGGGISLGSIKSIVLQILVPFVVGQALHPLLGAWAQRNRTWLGVVDRGSILMVVYGAFSEAVVNGLWRQLSPANLTSLVAVNILLLVLVLGATTWAARRMGFSRADEITIVFCGSKKSLASGVPIANILFPASAVGMIVLPLMLFHQIQLMACAVLARRYARQAPEGDTALKAAE